MSATNLAADAQSPASVDPEAVRSVEGASVEGERDIPSVNKERSLQARAMRTAISPRLAIRILRMGRVGGKE